MSQPFIEITSLSAIHHILSHKPERVARLFVQSTASGATRARIAEIQGLARGAGIPVDAGRGAAKGPSEPVRAMLYPFVYAEWDEVRVGLANEPRALVLALDHLQDPQNLGALCRSAEAFGVKALLIPRERSVAVSPGVYSASVGAVETIPICLVGNLGEALRKAKGDGYWIVGAALSTESKPPWETPDFEKMVLVLGAELEGLSPGLEKLCDWTTQIPINGKIESLNVSAAGAVLLYEMARREWTRKK